MDSSESKIATIVIRGATENYMDDIERAIDDGVNVYKGLCRDGRLVPGAGAIEMELAKQINAFGESAKVLNNMLFNDLLKPSMSYLKCSQKILV